jgi:hypothetical protein
LIKKGNALKCILADGPARNKMGCAKCAADKKKDDKKDTKKKK